MTKIQYQVRAAARSRGRPKIGPGPEADKAARLYAEGYSLREVGRAMKIGEHAVRLRLKAAGATVRTKAVRRSRLERLDQARLFGDIAAFGVSATAARHGIQKRTLQYYLAGLRREADKGKQG